MPAGQPGTPGSGPPRGPDAPGLLRPAFRAGRAGAARLPDREPDRGRPGRGRAHRGRGVCGGERSRLARIPREDGAERGDVRAARTRIRVLHLRHALLREPGLPGQRQRICGTAAGRPGHRGGGTRPRPADWGAPWGPGGIAPPERTQTKTAVPFRDLARGPARLCQALDIDRSLDGADVCLADSPLRMRWPKARTTDRSAERKKVASGPRVGVSTAAEVPWRFWWENEPTVSAYRPAVPRRRKLVTP